MMRRELVLGGGGGGGVHRKGGGFKSSSIFPVNVHVTTECLSIRKTPLTKRTFIRPSNRMP